MAVRVPPWRVAARQRQYGRAFMIGACGWRRPCVWNSTSLTTLIV